jgi:hypothetical protein
MSLASRATNRLRDLYGIIRRSSDCLHAEREGYAAHLPRASTGEVSHFEHLEPRLLLSATTYTVTSLADNVTGGDGWITLREAVRAASTNAAVGDAPAGSDTETDVIQFNVTGTITLTIQEELDIIDDLQILGPGEDVLTIDGDGSIVFDISGTGTDVELSNLTITGGGRGIEITDQATLTLTNSTVSDNDGTGVYIGPLAEAVLTNTTVSGNCSDFGGGIANHGTAWVTNTTVSGNEADSGAGGGIANWGLMTLTNSTVVGNFCSVSRGGGIYNGVSGYTYIPGELTLTNSTVAGNSANEYYGGIWNDSGTLTLNNTIVALNEAPEDADINGDTGDYAISGSLVGVDPDFVRDPDAGADETWGTSDDDYGDLHLSSDSYAIEHGNNGLAVDADGDPLTTDMDDNARISYRFVDAGAYEFQDEIDLEWQVLGAGDFNADGYGDVLWHDMGTGVIGAWLMGSGGSRTWTTLGYSVPYTDPWKVKGVGDFNADGYDDILWHKTTNGAIGVWLMGSGGSVTWLGLGTVSYTDLWQIEATGDYNADGYDDILWTYGTNGSTLVWLMDSGGTHTTTTYGKIKPTSWWQAASSGDYDGDGYDDILLQKTPYGSVAAWLMESGGTYTEALIGSINPAILPWRIVGSGDFDNDGDDDILWYKVGDGSVGAWIMEDGELDSWMNVGGVWHLPW